VDKKEYQNIRTSYDKSELNKTDLNENPILAFKDWFDLAIKSNVVEPNAMVLSTSTKDGKPSSRVVLLKEISKEGIVFYTNYKSKKGIEMESNPHVALLFFWIELQKQVRIEGTIIKNSSKDSDEYFRSRPLESQLGAMASNQSSILESKEELNEKFNSIKDSTPVRPDNWGGYIVQPSYFEFWQGRTNRLHDRISYEKEVDSWKVNRLSP